jgi:hypothetical protein
MSLHNAIIRAVIKGTEKWAKQRLGGTKPS